MPASIDHVIVLVLENRSFDHLLGFVPHPDAAFDGLTKGGPYTNPAWRNQGPPVPASSDAKPVLPADPDHSHDAVMQQLDIRGIGPARRPTNQGFVASYEEKGRGIAAPAFEGLLGPIANWWFRRQAGKRVVENRGPLVMACQAPERAPVLATLAQEFGVCSKWFASVPGETWPNRNYLHAATSDGTTNIVLRFYSDPTIFELLEERGKQWHVYHDDTPQIWAFKKLWEGDRRRNWFVFGEFAKHVREGRLPPLLVHRAQPPPTRPRFT
jgi:phospholipase C